MHRFFAPLFAGTRKRAKVCVLGASGGVGTLAVQIAKAENAEVTATCSTSAITVVEKLGVDRIIDYTHSDVEEQFRDLDFDIIVDCAGLGPEYATNMPWKFSRYVTLVPPILPYTDSSGLLFGTIRSVASLLKDNIQSVWYKRGFILWGIFRADRGGIEYLKKLADDDLLKPVIDSVFEFKSADKALQKMAEGHLRGKIIVKM